MDHRRHLWLAVAAGALLTLLAACTTPPAPGSGLGPITAASPRAIPTGTASAGASTGGSTPTSGAGSSASPAPSSSAGRPTRTFILASDYSVVQLHNCYWLQDGATHLFLSAKFQVNYVGILGAQPTTFTLTNDTNTYTTTGTATPGSPIQPTIGGQLFASSAWPGRTVVLTMTINPPGLDNSAADNVATVSLAVPSSPPTPDLAEPLTC
jgi:hypothetical protein